MSYLLKFYHQQAKSYQHRFEHGPLGMIRNSEKKAILSLLPTIKQQEILEFGCGSGFYTRLLLNQHPKHIHAVDLSESMLSQLPKGPITIYQGDAQSIKIPQKFSTLISCGLLEFVTNPSQVFNNLAYHALPHAQLILLIPINGLFGRLYQLYHKSHGVSIHLFTLKTINTLAKQNHWQIRSSRPCGLFSLALSLVRDLP